MSKLVKRLFNIAYAKVLTASETFLSFFTEDESAFSTFDPQTFISSYKDDFRAAIDAARASGTDEEQEDEQSGETEDVTVKMKESGDVFQKMKYWILKAFEGDITKQNQFGCDDYDDAMKSHDKMIVFMGTFKKMVTDNSAALIARGCPQALIDAVTVKELELRNEKTEQQVEIKKHRGVTQNRVTKYNAVWTIMSEINDASKQVFENDPARMMVYYMPETTSGNGDGDTGNNPPPPAA